MNHQTENSHNVREVLVEGSAEKKMETIVHEIEQALRKHKSLLKNFTVRDGWLGLALFYCYYARFTRDDSYLDEMEEAMDKAIRLMDYSFYQRKYPTDSYDYNLAGLGKFYMQCTRNGFLEVDDCSYLDQISNTLLDLCRNKIRYQDFSHFSGALAAGHYFLYDNCNESRKREILQEIVLGIKKAALKGDKEGVYWRNPKLKNRIYTGLTHGSAMTISFLSAVYEAGILQEECRELIRDAMDYVLGLKEEGKDLLFPYYIGGEFTKPQFSLCYGDLGVGYGLMRGATILEDEDKIKEARLVLEACLDKKYTDGMTWDGSITYGAAGLAHLFEKLSRLFPDESKYGNAYAYWIQQIPKYRVHDNEFAGFQSFISSYSKHFDLSFSWGISGIGISLMKYLKKDLPTLDGHTCAI